MNFDRSAPVDTLLGRLLAFIIMFEKKIQFLKCKLAGNQQFHTRLAFQILDSSKKNQISAEDICYALRSTNLVESQNNCAFFVRRYSKNNGITYEEFLKLVSPKANKTLSQRMMIRTYRKGAILQDYILFHLLELLGLYIKMSVITQNIRKSMQYNEDLSHLEIIEFFHIRIGNSHDLISFINQSQEERQEEYDIEPVDAIYLSYHIKSGNQIEDFNDLDIKELICPIDMNFQKVYNNIRVGNFSNNEYKEQPRPNAAKTSANFLGKTYQKIYQTQGVSNKSSKIKKQNNNFLIEGSTVNRDKIFNNSNNISGRINNYPIQDQSYGNMYIDNFTKSTVNDRLQLNKYAQYYQGKGRFEVFQDDLQNNSNLSRESAFDRS